jgi:RNA 2',3'-cyclic 3'-phosphodiesterase
MNTPLEPIPDMHPIRAFMAAAISEAVRDKLTELQERLKQTGADVGWVAPANIHLTLLFLGTVFESQASTLAAATDGITAGYRPCTLEVKGLGYFGRPQSPRVIWVGLAGDLQPLLDLQGAIAVVVEKTGIYTDAKPFHPHLTIGRGHTSRRAQELLRAIELCRGMAFGPLEIKSVDLMESELTAKGPNYKLLHASLLGRI